MDELRTCPDCGTVLCQSGNDWSCPECGPVSSNWAIRRCDARTRCVVGSLG